MVIKIAQISPVYPPYRGGMGNVAKEYTEGARNLGAEVDIITPDNYKPFLRWGHGAFLPLLIWHLRKYDIIHLHYPFFGASIATALSSRIFRKKLIITYHMVVDHKGLLGFLIKIYRQLFEKFILNSADKVLISSFDYAESIGISHRNLLEAPFRIDTAHFHPGDINRTKLNLPEDAFIFIFVGGMDEAHYFKGVPILLQAFARLNGDIHLALIGSGNLQPEFINLAKRLRIDDKVNFLGGVDDTAPYFRASNAHVFPSTARNEAFGIVTLEASSSGIPSIVSNLPGVRSVIAPNETGWLVAPTVVEDLREKMQYAIDNPDLVKEFGFRARQRAEEFYDKAKFSQELQELYGLVK